MTIILPFTIVILVSLISKHCQGSDHAEYVDNGDFPYHPSLEGVPEQSGRELVGGDMSVPMCMSLSYGVSGCVSYEYPKDHFKPKETKSPVKTKKGKKGKRTKGPGFKGKGKRTKRPVL
mmetsp:Transcript_19788/g.19899  ORF Transcript_19788/g.19899 Transcript_19788/m.19899 type:complete len:119 (-) Transcript_19788:188-544(-)|eukprot:CAMPEP_0182425230 /NCGR_PEP_ID=MMETSP1167-20130531/11588_1 /TAXON_ID=2988 /ORGANISM="Mallomonas Sp, Strain CCMP3275" /LENGTH=118 /DNA_ID=CAMNT_0024605721 /DNA_START=315 /DNA_END=671 /DNA_ORIENTATION=+